jgi:hypothetical protein
VYAKLGVHSRREAVQCARAVGLIAVPSGRRWNAGRPDGPEYRKADERPAARPLPAPALSRPA